MLIFLHVAYTQNYYKLNEYIEGVIVKQWLLKKLLFQPYTRKLYKIYENMQKILQNCLFKNYLKMTDSSA